MSSTKKEDLKTEEKSKSSSESTSNEDFCEDAGENTENKFTICKLGENLMRTSLATPSECWSTDALYDVTSCKSEPNCDITSNCDLQDKSSFETNHLFEKYSSF